MALENVFVTVGTTQFDKLVETVTSPSVLKVLKKKGCKNLVLQTGQGKMPLNLVREGISISSFRIKNSIEDEMKEADLIISHAGAGSCLGALNAKKPVVVVINEDLMENHQEELANKLHEGNHVFKSNCKSLQNVLETMNLQNLLPFPKGNANKYAMFIDNVMGY